MNTAFSLRTRQEDRGTPILDDWTVDSEYGVLRDVLLGSADYYQYG